MLIAAASVVAWVWLAVPVLTSTPGGVAASPDESVARAQQSFVSHCGACHGMDGLGGEHAPNIVTNPVMQNLSEAELERFVRNGVPAQGMPAFSSLGPVTIKTIVSYLRILQGKSAAMQVHGDAAHGRELFFRSARCSSCHMIQGEGGFLGADLTRYAFNHSVQEMRNAIVDPNRDLSPQAETVIVITRDGRRLTGLARNEDNFSLQLQTADGRFHLLMKSDLREIDRQPVALMPSDYGSKLSAGDLNDLMSFLVKATESASGPPAQAQTTPH
jgi:cytochrome c oxidase cbb3-type subunit III